MYRGMRTQRYEETYRGMRTHVQRYEETYIEILGHIYRDTRTHIEVVGHIRGMRTHMRGALMARAFMRTHI